MPKVAVTKDWLVKVAKNCRLNLTEQEQKVFLPQLDEILRAFETLNELDVSKEKPAFQPFEIQNVFREDQLKGCLDTETALKNAVHQKNPYFKGPKAIE